MKTMKLGKSGVDVPVIAVGCMRMADKSVEEAKAQAEAQRAQQEANAEAQRAQQSYRNMQQIRRDYPQSSTATNPYANYSTTRDSYPGESAQRAAAAGPQRPQPTQPIKAAPKVGRNDPCPCGSGKKYKNCHGKME